MMLNSELGEGDLLQFSPLHETRQAPAVLTVIR
jgi:hypothetical protein